MSDNMSGSNSNKKEKVTIKQTNVAPVTKRFASSDDDIRSI
jgi:hypothetical protein